MVLLNSTQEAGTLTINAPAGEPQDFDQMELSLHAQNDQTLVWDPDAYTTTPGNNYPTSLPAGHEVLVFIEFRVNAWRLLFAFSDIRTLSTQAATGESMKRRYKNGAQPAYDAEFDRKFDQSPILNKKSLTYIDPAAWQITAKNCLISA